MNHDRILELNLLSSRDHHAVSAAAHGMNRILHLPVFLALRRQLTDRLHQIILAADRNTGKRAQHLIIILLLHLNPHFYNACGEVQRLQHRLAHIVARKLHLSARNIREPHHSLA